MAEPLQFLNVREQLLHFPSMPRPLRILTGLGIAQIAVGTLVLLIKDLAMPTVVVGRQAGADLTMGLPVLLLATLLLISAWTYVLTGALQMRAWAAFAVLALATLVLWPTALSRAGWPAGPVALAAIWLYSLARKTRLRGVALPVDLLTLGGLVALLLLASLVMALATGETGQVWRYPLDVSSQMVTLLFFLIPILVLAGVDLAQLAVEISAWATSHVVSAVPIAVAAGAVMALAAAKILLHLQAGTALQPGTLVALSVVGVVILLSYLMRRSQAPAIEPAFWLLLLLSYLVFLVPVIGAAMAQLGALTAETGAAIGGSVQQTWTLAGAAAVALAVVALVAKPLRRRAGSRSLLFLFLFGAWILLTVGAPIAPPASDSGDPASARPLVSFAQLDIAASAAALILAAALLARRSNGRATLGLAAAGLVALSAVASLEYLYTRESSPGDLLVLLQISLLLALPAVALAGSIRAPGAGVAARRLAALGLLILVSGMLAALLILLAVALGMLPPGTFLPANLATATILALAISWDIFMSGGRLTNQDSAGFPRAGRILCYVGYVSLVAASLLWTKGLQQAGEAFFDEELLPRFGLIILGIPIILYGWTLAGRRLWAVRLSSPLPRGS